MKNSKLLLSVRPVYAQKIFDGTKTVELRRVPPRVERGDLVLVYVSSPIKALVGTFEVEKVVNDHPRRLWDIVQDRVGITRKEFYTYYAGASEAYGIFFSDVQSLSKPLGLETLRENWPDFHPPQGYCYLTGKKEYRHLSSKLVRRIDR